MQKYGTSSWMPAFVRIFMRTFTSCIPRSGFRPRNSRCYFIQNDFYSFKYSNDQHNRNMVRMWGVGMTRYTREGGKLEEGNKAQVDFPFLFTFFKFFLFFFFNYKFIAQNVYSVSPYMPKHYIYLLLFFSRFICTFVVFQ